MSRSPNKSVLHRGNTVPAPLRPGDHGPVTRRQRSEIETSVINEADG